MNTFRRCLMVLCLAALSIHLAAEDNAAQKRQYITQIMEITGASKLALGIMDQMIGRFKTMHPEVKDQVWESLRKEMKVEALMRRLSEVYDHYYSLDDLKGLLAFYQTPLGKKMITVMPKISQDSMQIGMQWGQEAEERVAKKLKTGSEE